MSSFDLNDSFGALLLSVILSSVLYGVMCLQAWYYFQNYSDGRLTKFAVAALVIFESLHSAFSIHAIYYYLILNYFNPVALLKATWSTAALVTVTHLIRIIVEMFYVWRIYIVSQRKAPLVIFLIFLELAALGTGFAVSVLVFQLEFWSDFVTLPKIVIPADTSLALSATIDLLIAASLTIYLHLNKGEILDTNKVIDRLVVHAVNNGIITSIASLLCLIFATTDKRTFIYIMIYELVGHLYANTMLSTLNTRRHMLSRDLPTTVQLSGLQFSEFRATAPSSIPNASEGNNKRYSAEEPEEDMDP